MGIRTVADAVEAVLNTDYDGIADLTPYIQAASNLVDQTVAKIASSGTSGGPDTATQELMERWLSAHMYTKMDPVYNSKSTGGQSGAFVRNQKNPEPYRDVAVMFDITGTLSAILQGNRASLFGPQDGFTVTDDPSAFSDNDPNDWD